jgi:hypothetical protein
MKLLALALVFVCTACGSSADTPATPDAALVDAPPRPDARPIPDAGPVDDASPAEEDAGATLDVYAPPYGH